MVASGRAQESFQLLFNRISKWNLECSMQPIFGELCSIRNLGETDRKTKIRAILDRQDQRVLKLMEFVVNGLKPRFVSDPQVGRIVLDLDALVATDRNSSTGLSQSTIHALEIAKSRLANEIERRLSINDLDLDQLSMLLGGRPGATLVCEA